MSENPDDRATRESIATFLPSPEAARAFAQFLTTLTDLRGPDNSVPPSDLPPQNTQVIPASPEQNRSRHVLLTDERLEQLSHQRTSGQTSHQRLLRAQATLRDGTLPFSKPGQAPQPSGQVSPRQRAQAEGGFADGAAPVGPKAPQLVPEAGRRKRSQLRPVAPAMPGQRPPLTPRPLSPKQSQS